MGYTVHMYYIFSGDFAKRYIDMRIRSGIGIGIGIGIGMEFELELEIWIWNGILYIFQISKNLSGILSGFPEDFFFPDIFPEIIFCRKQS